MKHARPDYQSIQPWPQKRPHIARDNRTGKVIDLASGDEITLIDAGQTVLEPIIPDDEPVMLLRGQDPLAWRAVAYYGALLIAAAADPAMVDMVKAHTTAMKEWAQQTGRDLPDLAEGFGA